MYFYLSVCSILVYTLNASVPTKNILKYVSGCVLCVYNIDLGPFNNIPTTRASNSNPHSTQPNNVKSSKPKCFQNYRVPNSTHDRTPCVGCVCYTISHIQTMWENSSCVDVELKYKFHLDFHLVKH